jgi:lysophospholipase L1-like esterase
MQQNQIRQPLILVFAVTLLLSILSFINTTKLFSNKLKPVDLFSDLKPTKKDSSTQKVKQSIAAAKTKTAKAKANDLAIHDYSITEENSFAHFISLLQNAKSRKVRIAYFGDSFIESDLVTNELRQLLQKQYGGNGVGFVPMECINSEMRKSVVQTTNNNWVVNENASKLLKVFTANDSYTKYSLQQPYKNCTTAKLLYQSAQNSTINIETDSSNYEKILPSSNNNLIAQKINQNTFSTLKISSNSSVTNFYGISFEDSTGVYVDNFSTRGSNGTHLLKLDTTTLQQFNAVQQYNLIVLHFGVNVLNNDANLDWYKIGLQKTILFLQQQFPNTAILIISTSDKATKTNGIYETDKGVTTLVTIQNEMAQKNGIAFWNLYQNMGGYNSMLNWVNADTALAYKDYTHINFKGAAKVANLLYQHINNFK